MLTMIRMAFCLPFAIMALLTSLPVAGQTATCTPQCVQSYQARGLPAWEAQRVCRCTGAGGGTAANCVTTTGTCRMSTAVQPGTACVCASAQGPVAGRAQ
ncbi:hypothetical protein STHU_38250 [Allostella humosa]|nr:hypothetical protein [Stella humosa]BBK33191.1 hypothetical protein STHU_38250 [Stella humosa]